MAKRNSPGCGCCAPPCSTLRVCVVARGACGELAGGAVAIAKGAFTGGCTLAGGSCCVDVSAGGLGTYTWSVSAPGYLTASGTVAVSSCGESWVVVELTRVWPATITLHDPIGNAITLAHAGGGGYVGSHTYTSAQPVYLGCSGTPYDLGIGQVTIGYAYICGALTLTYRIGGPLCNCQGLAADSYPASCAPKTVDLLAAVVYPNTYSSSPISFAINGGWAGDPPTTAGTMRGCAPPTYPYCSSAELRRLFGLADVFTGNE